MISRQVRRFRNNRKIFISNFLNTSKGSDLVIIKSQKLSFKRRRNEHDNNDNDFEKA